MAIFANNEGDIIPFPNVFEYSPQVPYTFSNEFVQKAYLFIFENSIFDLSTLKNSET